MGEHTEAHSEPPRVTLEGTYTPPDYLEEPVTVERPEYTTTIKKGRIQVVFHDPEPSPNQERRFAIAREVSQVFQSHMVFTLRPWEITSLTLHCRYPDGREGVSINVSAPGATGALGKVDIVTKDADDNVITDTRAERLADARVFESQRLRHAEDPLLENLIASFRRAVADPADRMTHLYEIRDALQRRFETKRGAKDALGLTDAEWGDLDDITNNQPIEESRHRGRYLVRRPATEDEHNRVFAVARRMIRAYLDHLDRSSTAT